MGKRGHDIITAGMIVETARRSESFRAWGLVYLKFGRSKLRLFDSVMECLLNYSLEDHTDPRAQLDRFRDGNVL